MTLVRALKEGSWHAASMAHQLDEDLLPDCPFPGASARYVWDDLRDLQLAYQDRHDGWRDVPAQFERLARALPSVVELERLARATASHTDGAGRGPASFFDRYPPGRARPAHRLT